MPTSVGTHGIISGETAVAFSINLMDGFTFIGWL
jgi:hypothetical protein